MLSRVLRAALRAFFALSAAFVLLACEGAPADPDVRVHIAWLTRDPQAALPSDIQSLRVLVFRDGEEEPFEESTFTVAGLMRNPEETPILVRRGLPTEEPIRLTIEGLAEGAEVAYVGHVGPVTLMPGERRYIELFMYEIGTPSIVMPPPGINLERMLATATSLVDGRVLVAGGFSVPGVTVTCPADLPEGTRCSEVRALRDGVLFDPASGVFTAVPGAMLEARGGHTATRLADGRVIVAGGAPRAIVALDPRGATITAYEPRLVPRLDDGDEGALATFEIFDPEAGAEIEDTQGDGDISRGRFLGPTGNATPGTLNDPRFLHAAALVPKDATMLVLFGGSGGPDSAQSYEVFDAERSGGPGVYDNAAARLGIPREWPSAVTLENSIWVFGGGIAHDNAGLADVWTVSATEPNGLVQPAAGSGRAYPNPTSSSVDKPEYAHVRPAVAPLEHGQSAVVVSWLGARCPVADTMPFFPDDDDESELCGHEPSPGMRNYTVTELSGATQVTPMMDVHAFAEATALDDGTVVVTGGISNLLFTKQPAIEVFTGTTTGGMADRDATMARLRAGRFFHAAAALPQRGVLIVGGVVLSADGRTVTQATDSTGMMVAQPEVLYLPRR